MATSTNFVSLTNHFLIAMPGLNDPIFEKTVVYICEHNAEGTVGIVVNLLIESVKLGDVLTQVDIPCDNAVIKDAPVFYGGPLQTDKGFVLHRPFGQWKFTLDTGGPIMVTTSQDILRALAENQGPPQILMALGYAGWTPEQLDAELLNNLWLTCPAVPDIVFDTPVDLRWKKAAALLGVDIDTLSGSAGHA